MLRHAKERATGRGAHIPTHTPSPFLISSANFQRVPTHCPILGLRLNWGPTRPGQRTAQFDSPSLDRINPRLGYIPSNTRIVSFLGNSAKAGLSDRQFRRMWKVAMKEITDHAS